MLILNGSGANEKKFRLVCIKFVKAVGSQDLIVQLLFPMWESRFGAVVVKDHVEFDMSNRRQATTAWARGLSLEGPTK